MRDVLTTFEPWFEIPMYVHLGRILGMCSSMGTINKFPMMKMSFVKTINEKSKGFGPCGYAFAGQLLLALGWQH